MGTVSISGTGVKETSAGYTAPENTLVTFDVDIDDEDYVLDYYTVNGTRIDGNTWPVSADALILAVLKSRYHNINISADPEEGMVYVPTHPPTKEGDTVSFNWTTSSGYEYSGYDFTSGEFSNPSVTSSSCSFTMGDTDVSVTIHFVPTHTVTVQVMTPGGDASLVNSNPVGEGKTVQINVSPASGYHLDYLTVNGGTPTTSTTFTMPASDVLVQVYFAAGVTTYPISITASPDEGGFASASENAAAPGTTVCERGGQQRL